jgi:hypothetical protein
VTPLAYFLATVLVSFMLGFMAARGGLHFVLRRGICVTCMSDQSLTGIVDGMRVHFPGRSTGALRICMPCVEQILEQKTWNETEGLK